MLLRAFQGGVLEELVVSDMGVHHHTHFVYYVKWKKQISMCRLTPLENKSLHATKQRYKSRTNFRISHKTGKVLDPR